MNSFGVPTIPHGHTEHWVRVAGLRPELDALADDVLPALRAIKRQLIGLGAVALDPGRRAEVPGVALALAAMCDRYAAVLRHGRHGGRAATLVRTILELLREVRGCAYAATKDGLSAPVAAALAGAYRDLRAVCAGLWPCELAAEGRPPDGMGGSGD